MRPLALLLLLALPSHAEPAFEWLAFGGGAKNDKTRGVTFDAAGNAFLAGETTGDGEFGGVKRMGAGDTDFMLVKVSPEGRVLWVRSLGGSLVDRGYGVVTDAAGEVYVTGHYQSQDAVAPKGFTPTEALGQTLPNAGDYDLFVAKFSTDGELRWIRTGGGKGYDYGHGIVIDGAGDVIISGAVAGEAVLGGVTVNSGATSRAILCAKFHANGELVWARTSSGKLSGSGHGIGVDEQGHLYIGGNGSGSGTFGSLALELGARASVVLKLTPQGEPVWAATHPGAGIHEITADATGRVWAAGMFEGTAQFGAEKKATTGAKDDDGFLCHYDTHGKLQWTRYLSSPGKDYCLGVATDGSGRAFVTGEFSATAKLGDRELQSLGSTDVCTAAFDEKGSLQWVVANGGPKGDNAYTIAWHPSGRLLIGGSCAAPAQFGAHRMDKAGANEAYGAVLKW